MVRHLLRGGVMSAERAVMIGIDVGGSTTSGGIVTDAGEILSTVQMATHQDGPGTAVGTLLNVVDALVSTVSRRGLSLDGIGIGLPGLVDAEKGMMVGDEFNYVQDFKGVPLADQLRSFTEVPVFVDNDVNLLALGDWIFGLGKDATSLVLLAIGTGVGGGIILNGNLVRGHSGCAGELGHVPINFNGPPCVCGGRGCLCVYVGGQQIAATAQERVGRTRESSLLGLADGNLKAITAELVFKAAASGDAVARAIVDEALDALGAGLGAIFNALNPEVVIVTGGVAESLVPIEHEVRDRAARYALAEALATTRFHIVRSDKRRTVLGGAALVLYELGRQRNA